MSTLLDRADAAWRRVWHSLFGRLAVILFCGLTLAHLLTVGWVLYERAQLGRSMMLAYLGRDVASALAILDRVPTSERSAWLPRIERQGYRYVLAAPALDRPDASGLARSIRESVASGVGTDRVRSQAMVGVDADDRIELGLRLADGSPVTLQLNRPAMRISPTTATLLFLQLLVLGLVTWLAVRAAVRPLRELADAADNLDLHRDARPLAETGPTEVLRAVRAFNAMRRRIAEHLAERLCILASVSHDLRTPITRMRLRADLLAAGALRDKLQGDLAQLEALVEEGVAYARSAQASAEAVRAVDLNALLDGLVCDAVDAGQAVRLSGSVDTPFRTRPLALRRLVTNLLDNAVKFAGSAELLLEQTPAGAMEIVVRDNGPGIPHAELDAVLQPFYRVESSRSRDSGGTGLGLAIAQELAKALEGTLSLTNRSAGGLDARVSLRAGLPEPIIAA